MGENWTNLGIARPCGVTHAWGMGNQPLQFGTYYHIYNRGNNGERLFVQRRNYRFFLQRYAHYIEPVAITFAYCLLPNHFHFAIRTRTPEEQVAFWRESGRERMIEPSRAFNNFFIAYARAFNRAMGRTGALFERPFHRKMVEDKAYFLNLISYIHHNPQQHGLVSEFWEWPWSSYGAHVAEQESKLAREKVLSWFNGHRAFVAAHKRPLNEKVMGELVLEDWD